MSDPADLAMAYYRAIDNRAYDTLRSLLAPEFSQTRPDRTFEDPDTFIQFMRDHRPEPDATHAIDAVYRDGQELAVRGRVLKDDTELVAFVDVFEIPPGTDSIASLRTFTG